MPSSPDPSVELDAAHLGPEVVERYLRRNGLTSRKRFGQNHLVDGDVLEAIVGAAAVQPGRHVLEIGPGIGILTAPLLAAGAQLTAVEVDARLALHLRERFAGVEALRLVEGDFLDEDLDDLVTAPWDLIANLPYSITSPVLHRVLEAEPRPERFVLMLQREVAERIAAPPGAMSYLSVFVQYHAAVRVIRQVPATSFEPVPEVASAVLSGETQAAAPGPGARGRPVATGTGRIPRAPQDAPQRARPAAAGHRSCAPAGGAGRGGHRPRSPAADRLGRGVAGAGSGAGAVAAPGSTEPAARLFSR